MELKDLILIGGGLLIAIVVAHGLWITWRARRDPLKLRIDERLIAAVGDRDPVQTEFPNGGARVVGRGDAVPTRGAAERAARMPPDRMEPGYMELDRMEPGRMEPGRMEPGRMEPALSGSRPPRESDREDPVAQDEPASVGMEAGTGTASGPRMGSSDTFGAPGLSAPATATPAAAAAATSASALASAPASRVAAGASVATRKPAETPMVREPVADDPSRRGASAARRAQDALRALGKAASGRSASPAPRVNAPASNPPAREPVSGDGGPEELILINVLAPREQPFTGTQVIDALRANGLRYGEMNIFHRIDAERRVIQFSIANIIEPGTFDLADIDAFRSPGLCFFLRLPGPESPIDAFDDMQRTARDVAQRLAGELKDERRSVLTAQTIEHYRGRVAEYCRRRMSIRA